MRLGVVSDTHGHAPFTTEAVRLLDSEHVDVVIHCGDIGSPQIVPLFAGWPTHFVFGNVDHDRAGLRRAILEAGQTCHDRFGELDLAGRRVAFLHGDDAVQFQSAVDQGEYDLICFGHTHIAERTTNGGTILLNPGALYRAQPHTIAVVDLPELEIRHITVMTKD